MKRSCKHCGQRRYRAEHRDEIKERRRRYRAEHRDEIKEKERILNKIKKEKTLFLKQISPKDLLKIVQMDEKEAKEE